MYVLNTLAPEPMNVLPVGDYRWKDVRRMVAQCLQSVSVVPIFVFRTIHDYALCANSPRAMYATSPHLMHPGIVHLKLVRPCVEDSYVCWDADQRWTDHIMLDVLQKDH